MLRIPHSPIPPPLTVIIRLVRMTLRPDALEVFLERFDASSPQIRAFPGCRHLELWQHARHPHIVSTYSLWDDAAALEGYRRSTLFRTTWAEVKPLFAAPPEARSHTALRTDIAPAS